VGRREVLNIMARANRKFNQGIKRSYALIAYSREAGDANIKDECVRMAVVLAVAAMDDYFTSKFRDMLSHYLKRNMPGDDLLKLLEDAGLDTRMALELIYMERPLRRVGTLIERYFDRYTTQRFDVIDKLFMSVGLKNLCENAERKTGKKRLRASVKTLVEKRHLIVHDADINAHARIRKVDVDRIEKRITDIEEFVLASDSILENSMHS